MSLIRKTGQALVASAWYASHPKTAYADMKGYALSLLDSSKESWRPFGYGSTYTGRVVTDTTALEISASWSAIRLISETIGTLPVHLYQKTDNGRVKATDHKLYRLIHLQPNPYMTSAEFFEALTVSLCCQGMAYAKPERLGDRVAGIVPLAKDVVTAQLKDGVPRYLVNEDGQQNTYERGQIIPIRGFGAAGQLEGFPPFKLHRHSLALAAAAEEYGSRFFGNGARPGGVITFEKWLTDDQRKKAKEKFEDMHRGLGNSNKVAILEGDAKYHATAASNNEAQFIETRKHQIAEIARIWRVPLHLLMEADRATHNNSEQENLHFLQYTLRPYLVRIEQALNTTLLTREEQRQGYYIEFDVRGLLRGDSKSRGEYYRNMRMIGAMSINDVRRAENLPEDPDGNDLHVPLNMGPADQIREILGGNDGEN